MTLSDVAAIFLPRPREMSFATARSLDDMVERLRAAFSPSWLSDFAGHRLVGRADQRGVRVALYRPFRMLLFNPEYRGQFVQKGPLLYLEGAFDFTVAYKGSILLGALFLAAGVVFGTRSGPSDPPEVRFWGGRLIPLGMLLLMPLASRLALWMRQWDADELQRRLERLFRDEFIASHKIESTLSPKQRLSAEKITK